MNMLFLTAEKSEKKNENNNSIQPLNYMVEYVEGNFLI